MANKFKDVAVKTLSLSELMAGREQLKTEELIGETLTIIAFDFATITDKGETKTFPVVLFKERPGYYYNGGTLLQKLCIAWAEMFNGDFEVASDELEKSGGVEIRFRSTKTKSGNNLTSVDVV